MPAFALLIVVAAAGDLDGKRSAYSKPWLVKLGEWSFAAYLTHLLVLELVERLAPDSLPSSGVGGWAVEIVLLDAFVGIAALIYTFIERPVERLIHGRFTNNRARTRHRILIRKHTAIRVGRGSRCMGLA